MSSTTPTHDSEGRPIRGWAVEGTDPESVPADIKEAIEEAWDVNDPNPPADEQLPEQVVVVGYVPLDLPSVMGIAERMRQEIEDALGEEYGNPEAGPPELPSSAKEAIRNAAQVIRETYPVYWLKPSDVRVTVNPRDFYEEGMV